MTARLRWPGVLGRPRGDDGGPQPARLRGARALRAGTMGSPMSTWGLTPHIPSDREESGHGKDGPNAYRLQPSPYGLSGRNAPFAEEISPFLSIFFWLIYLLYASLLIP